MMSAATHAIRGRVLTFTGDEPAAADEPPGHRYLSDGLVVMQGGHITAVGDAAALLPTLPAGTLIDRYPGALILPGLIDTHIHYPQTQVIASYGAQLIDWLNTYTFPEEQRLADRTVADDAARFFLDELLRNGTTTACVYCTVHPASVDAFFTEAARRGMRMIAGKVMMDRNAPPGLLDTAAQGHAETEDLLRRWHGRDRLLYAITPRFAITSTPAQLDAAGALLRAYPDAYVQTHLNENHREIATVRALFPDAASYTDVYARAGLLGPRTLLGHCIHMHDAELDLLADSGAVAVFCPTSNLFLGSGLFDRARLRGRGRPVRVALATDVGGGTSYSMLRTAAAGYTVLQMQGQSWPGLAMFHQLTRGNAQALGLADRIGSLSPGHEADVVVLSAAATPAMLRRLERVGDDLAAELFLLATLGDDRAVQAVYIAGQRVLPAP